MSTIPRVAIIGAGWAGLTAAVELADRGIPVDVYEASKTLGGRARSVQWGNRIIDNGQHILIGAYTETLRLMRKVGVDPESALLRLPLTLHYPGEFRMVAPRVPAPFHTALALALAQGLDWREKLAAMRLMWRLKRDGYSIDPDITVTAWLDRHAIPSRQRRLLWEPLCVSALNTPAERASAQIMANVLRDSLGGPREASDMLIPKWPLSDCFPEPAARWIEARGGRVLRATRAQSLAREAEQWYLCGEAYAHVVVATAPYHVAPLSPDRASQVANWDYEPIITSYFDFAARPRLRAPMLGIDSGLAQWVFDRLWRDQEDRIIATVTSARGRHSDLLQEAFERHVLLEISRLQRLPEPAASRTIVEKRATFRCVPSLERPQTQTASIGLWLAGDYVAGEYPATLEGAVRSGMRVAEMIGQTISYHP